MVGYLYDYLEKVYQDQWDEKGNYKQKDKPININLDVIGFSRGAASARMFASKVQKIMSDGTWYAYRQEYLGGAGKSAQSREWKYTTQFLKNCGIDFKFNFMGLWDTVPAYGLAQNNDMRDLELHGMNLNVRGSDFKTIVHAVAANENRYQFGRRSIYEDPTQAKSQNGVVQSDGKYRLEKGFLGAHSDIGGGYESGDLSNVALMWMIKQAQERGNIKFDEAMISTKQYDQINNPIVHDSVWSVPFLYTMGGQFRWANDDSNGFAKHSIFNNFEHLSLNWNDTKAFQNPNHKQFDKVENITKLYLKSPDSQYAIYPAMLANPWTYAQHYRYVRLKDDKFFGSLADMVKGADSVLMANEEGKVIAIHDYLKWLNCHYDIDLYSTVKDAPHLPTDIDVCKGTNREY